MYSSRLRAAFLLPTPADSAGVSCFWPGPVPYTRDPSPYTTPRAMVRFHGRPRYQSAARRAGQSPAQADQTSRKGHRNVGNTNGTPQNEPTQEPTQGAAQQQTQSQAPVDAGAHGDPAPLTAKAWNHILYGYDDDGGHMHGYGWIHGKPSSQMTGTRGKSSTRASKR